MQGPPPFVRAGPHVPPVRVSLSRKNSSAEDLKYRSDDVTKYQKKNVRDDGRRVLAAIARDNGAGLSGAAVRCWCLCGFHRMDLTEPPVRVSYGEVVPL